MCGLDVCPGHALAGVILAADRGARKVRFTVGISNAGPFCGGMPAREALDLAERLAAKAREALS